MLRVHFFRFKQKILKIFFFTPSPAFFLWFFKPDFLWNIGLNQLLLIECYGLLNFFYTVTFFTSDRKLKILKVILKVYFRESKTSPCSYEVIEWVILLKKLCQFHLILVSVRLVKPRASLASCNFFKKWIGSFFIVTNCLIRILSLYI